MAKEKCNWKVVGGSYTHAYRDAPGGRKDVTFYCGDIFEAAEADIPFGHRDLVQQTTEELPVEETEELPTDSGEENPDTGKTTIRRKA